MTAALLWLKLRAWAKPGLDSGADLLARIGWKGGCIALTVLSVFLTIQLVTQPAKIRDRIVTKVERQIEKATAKEVVRVERQMVPVRTRSKRDADDLENAKTTIAQLREIIRNASSPYDGNLCIDADGVRQLTDISEVLRNPGR